MKALVVPVNFKESLSVFILWLMHISAIIGISLGNTDWFATKTPMTLLLLAVLLFWVFPVNTTRSIVFFVVCALVGFTAEYLGVNYGLIFGNYAYGANFGFKLGQVPVLIGINWAVLVFATGALAGLTKLHWIFKAVLGAMLMVFLDVFLEVSAPIFDYWKFDGGIPPLQNYIGWFLVAFGLQVGYDRLQLAGNPRIAFHLFMVQVVYFGYFAMYFLQT